MKRHNRRGLIGQQNTVSGKKQNQHTTQQQQNKYKNRTVRVNDKVTVENPGQIFVSVREKKIEKQRRDNSDSREYEWGTGICDKANFSIYSRFFFVCLLCAFSCCAGLLIHVARNLPPFTRVDTSNPGGQFPFLGFADDNSNLVAATEKISWHKLIFL